LEGLEFKEDPTLEDLKIGFEKGYDVVVEHKKRLWKTQPSITKIDTQVNKINEDYLKFITCTIY
jgi:hypothetical protein